MRRYNTKQKAVALILLLIFCMFWYFLNTKTYQIDFNDTDTAHQQVKLKESVDKDVLPDVEKYKVRFVIDGDTFILTNGRKVRLIGVYTPERFQEYYGEAKNRMMELVLNKEVTLVKDISEVDKYDRLLRYVYINDEFVNLKMVEEGYARVLTVSPDIKYKELFNEAERIAKKDNIGIWSN